MKNPDNTYTSPYDHLSHDQLIRYQQDKMDDAEMHRVERHLLECELCSDALEGLELLEAKDAERALQDIRGRLSARLNEEKSSSKTLYWKWGIAASVLLMVGAVFFLWNSGPLNMQEQENRKMVQQQPEPGEESPEVPYISYRKEKEGEPSVESKGTPPPEAGREEENRNSVPQSPEEKAAPQPIMEVEMDEEEFEEVSPEAEETNDTVIEEIRFNPENSVAERHSDRNSTVVSGVPVDRPSNANLPEITVAESVEYVKRQEIAPGRVVQTGTGSAESKILKGKVTDSSGEPLPGVNVRLAGSDKGTITNLNGEYSLPLPVEDALLDISFIGYETKNIPVDANETQLLAVLEEDVKSLSEVVVIGYGAQKRRDVTGTVSTVAEFSPPKPAEGMKSFKKYLKQHQRYTAGARETKVEGAVIVEFFVEPDGALSNFRIRKSLGYGLDEEAIRLLKEGPAWLPATSGEETISHKVRVRVPFKLD